MRLMPIGQTDAPLDCSSRTLERGAGGRRSDRRRRRRARNRSRRRWTSAAMYASSICTPGCFGREQTRSHWNWRAGRVRARPRSSMHCAGRCAIATGSASSPTTSSRARTWSFSCASEALTADRIIGVQTGGCPHTAIREDASMNFDALDAHVGARIPASTSSFSRAAATTSPRASARSWSMRRSTSSTCQAATRSRAKAGPGVTRSDLLGHQQDRSRAARRRQTSDVMARDAKLMRGDRPLLFTNLKRAEGLPDVVAWIQRELLYGDQRHWVIAVIGETPHRPRRCQAIAVVLSALAFAHAVTRPRGPAYVCIRHPRRLMTAGRPRFSRTGRYRSPPHRQAMTTVAAQRRSSTFARC